MKDVAIVTGLDELDPVGGFVPGQRPAPMNDASFYVRVLPSDAEPKSLLSDALHHLLARIRSAFVKVGDFPRGDAQPPLDTHGIPAIPMAKGMVAG